MVNADGYMRVLGAAIIINLQVSGLGPGEY